MSKKTLKYENVAAIDDFIKAYDFQPMEGREPRWVIGRVTAKGMTPGGWRGYTIMVRQTSHLQYEIESIVYVPFQMSFMEYEGRVTRFK